MPLTWNEKRKRYLNEEGKVVSAATVRSLLQKLYDAGREDLISTTQRFLEGRIDRSTWESEMKRTIKATHTTSAAVARGGWNQMTKSDWGWTGKRVRSQYDFIREFAQEVDDARTRDETDGRILLVRAAMYAESARGTHSQMERRSQKQGGKKEEKRILNSGAKHCEECKEEASKGWSPLGTLKAIGDTRCITNCRCYFSYR